MIGRQNTVHCITLTLQQEWGHLTYGSKVADISLKQRIQTLTKKISIRPGAYLSKDMSGEADLCQAEAYDQ